MSTGSHAEDAFAADTLDMGIPKIHPRLSMCCICVSALVQTAVILLVTAYPRVSVPAIFACPVGNTTVYQDMACPQKQPVANKTKARRQFPLGMHASWFDRPRQANDMAFCNVRGCDCGEVKVKFPVSMASAVADALYIDGSWHRYETGYQSWISSPEGSDIRRESRQQMLDAACHVMMSQVTLHQFANDTLKALKNRASKTEKPDFDNEQACEQGLPEACNYLDSMNLLTRIERDAAVLKRARESISP